MRSRFPSSFFLLALLILLCVFAAGENAWKNPAFAETLLNELDTEEIAAAKYYRLMDEEGKIITVTGRRIRIGDRYLDEKPSL